MQVVNNEKRKVEVHPQNDPVDENKNCPKTNPSKENDNCGQTQQQEQASASNVPCNHSQQSTQS
jgi:hypothetical protein